MINIENVILHLEELISKKKFELENLEHAVKIVRFTNKQVELLNHKIYFENDSLRPEFEKYFRENFWDLLA